MQQQIINEIITFKNNLCNRIIDKSTIQTCNKPKIEVMKMHYEDAGLEKFSDPVKL